MNDSELNGHIELVEQCRDYLAHKVMDSGDPSGKLHDFVGSLQTVLSALSSTREKYEQAVREVEEYKADRKQFNEIMEKTNSALNLAGCYSALYYWEHIDAIAAERDRLRELLREACNLFQRVELVDPVTADEMCLRMVAIAKEVTP